MTHYGHMGGRAPLCLCIHISACIYFNSSVSSTRSWERGRGAEQHWKERRGQQQQQQQRLGVWGIQAMASRGKGRVERFCFAAYQIMSHVVVHAHVFCIANPCLSGGFLCVPLISSPSR